MSWQKMDLRELIFRERIYQKRHLQWPHENLKNNNKSEACPKNMALVAGNFPGSNFGLLKGALQYPANLDFPSQNSRYRV